MHAYSVICPACSAAAGFSERSAEIVLCPTCRSAIERAGDQTRIVGKFGEIVDSSSKFEIGGRGQHRGAFFELVGRVRYRHELGGFWDEWQLRFDDGRAGILTESPGFLRVSTPVETADDSPAPDIDAVEIGVRSNLIPGNTEYYVSEKGTTEAFAAEGELLFPVVPDRPIRYVDLTGPNHACASVVNFVAGVRIFVGRDVTITEISMTAAVVSQSGASDVIECPACRKSEKLLVPSKSVRYGCRSCGALLDVGRGDACLVAKQTYLHEFQLAVGAKANFTEFGGEFTIVGALARSVVVQGEKYFWEEYLIYSQSTGLRWLVQSDLSWSFVDPVNGAEVAPGPDEIGGGPSTVTYNDRSFQIYQSIVATAECVKGEFYWRVGPGEQVKAADYVAPPFQLSCETSPTEVIWSRATYLDRRVVEKAFGLPLPAATLVAPNEPYHHNRLLRASLIVTVAFSLFAALVSAVFPEKKASKLGVDESFSVKAASGASETVTIYTSPFHLIERERTYVGISTDLDYETSADFESTLVKADAESNRIDPVRTSIIGYRPTGVIDYASETIEPPAEGDYQLRLTGKWREWSKDHQLSVQISQYSPVRPPYGVLIAILLGAFAVGMLFHRYSFEWRRWQYAGFRPPGVSGEVFSGMISGD